MPAIRTRFRSRSRWPSCRRSRRHSGLVGVGTRIGTGRPSTGQDRAGKDTTATGLKAAENLTPWYGTGRAGRGPSALQNRCTATVLTRPASLNYNGYLNARSSATAVASEIATQRLISARHTPT
jgi:hypothetical protein